MTSKNYSNELSQLVINNMKVVEIAPKVVEKIEEKLFKKMNERCEKYVMEEMPKFMGQFDMCSHEGKGDEGIVFYPEDWKNDGKLICKYFLQWENDEGEDLHWLTVLLGAYNNAHSSFRYEIAHNELKINLTGFKRKLTEHYYNNLQLKELGFKLGGKGEYIYLPFQLDKNILIDEYPDNLDAVYDVVIDSLEKIKKAHNIFKRLTQDIVKKAGYK